MPDAVVSRTGRLLQEETLNNYNFLSVGANYTMKASDHLVHCTLGASITVTLPSVAEAVGGIYVIKGVGAGTGPAAITDAEDALADTDISIDLAGEFAVLFCDGEQWYTLLTNVT